MAGRIARGRTAVGRKLVALVILGLASVAPVRDVDGREITTPSILAGPITRGRIAVGRKLVPQTPYPPENLEQGGELLAKSPHHALIFGIP